MFLGCHISFFIHWFFFTFPITLSHCLCQPLLSPPPLSLPFLTCFKFFPFLTWTCVFSYTYAAHEDFVREHHPISPCGCFLCGFTPSSEPFSFNLFNMDWCFFPNTCCLWRTSFVLQVTSQSEHHPGIFGVLASIYLMPGISLCALLLDFGCNPESEFLLNLDLKTEEHTQIIILVPYWSSDMFL